jgi:type IV secretion system protein TrbL
MIKVYQYLGSLIILMIMTSQAFGAEPAVSGDVFRDVLDNFKDQTNLWFGPLQSIANTILFSLAIIGVAWSLLQMLVKNADIQDVLFEVIRQIMFVGFFLALILYSDVWSSAIIQGFLYAGKEAAGTAISGELNPAAIFERGLILSDTIMKASGSMTYLGFLAIAMVTALLYTLVAIHALMVMIEVYIVTAAGVLFLGFGGLAQTSDYPKQYIKYCFSSGAKFFAMFLVVGLGEQLIYNWAMRLEHGSFIIGIAIAACTMMLFHLTKTIPDIVQGLVNGTSVGSGAYSVSGMAVGTAGAAVGAAAGAIGGAMAVREASKLASSTGAGNSGGVAGAMGHTGKMLKNLGAAAMQTVGGRVMGDFASKNGTLGGSLAQKIREQRLSGMGGSTASTGQVSTNNQAGEGGSISKGSSEGSNTAYHSPASSR